jgi:predicted metal-dependent phosphoesterase TrpH
MLRANMSSRAKTFLPVCFTLFLLCLAVPASPAQEPASQPQLVLKGVVTYAQNHSLIDLPFDVPQGVHRLTVDIRYTDREKQTVLNTEISDPYRFRGTSGSNKNHFTIGENDATPSFLPGAIPAGKWKLTFVVSNIRQDMTSSYEADIYFDRPIDDVAFVDHPLNTKPGWYRGDLHMHTAHSDGSCSSQSGQSVPCPVFFTAEAAAKRGLDFIAISDHNSTSQYDALRELQPYFDRLLFIPGREITTTAGHANLFGTMRYLDYHVGDADTPDVNTLAKRARDLGGILSINHADAPGGEICRGCRWEPNPPIDMHLIAAVEVINGGDGEGLFPSYQFWQRQLAAGYRPTAIGGSDNHRPDWPLEKPGSVGSPTTVVHAQELSVPAILNGIRSGHVFIDLSGSSNRLLEVEASDTRGKAVMGDALSAEQNEEVHLAIHIEHCAADQVAVLLDGAQPLPTDRKILLQPDEKLSATWKSDGKRHWITVEVRDLTGALYLLGNPIYFNY